MRNKRRQAFCALLLIAAIVPCGGALAGDPYEIIEIVDAVTRSSNVQSNSVIIEYSNDPAQTPGPVIEFMPVETTATQPASSGSAAAPTATPVDGGYYVAFYDWYGREIGRAVVAEGEGVLNPGTVPHLEGYEFQFWFDESGEEVTPYAFGEAVSGNVNLIPYFRPVGQSGGAPMQAAQIDSELARMQASYFVSELVRAMQPSGGGQETNDAGAQAQEILDNGLREAAQSAPDDIIEFAHEGSEPPAPGIVELAPESADVPGVIEMSVETAPPATETQPPQAAPAQPDSPKTIDELLGLPTAQPATAMSNDQAMTLVNEILTQMQMDAALKEEEAAEIVTLLEEDRAQEAADMITDIFEEPQTQAIEDEAVPLAGPDPYVVATYHYEGALRAGTEVTVKANVYNLPAGQRLSYQWQNDKSGTFEDVPGATGETHTFVVDEHGLSRSSWRVNVILLED